MENQIASQLIRTTQDDDTCHQTTMAPMEIQLVWKTSAAVMKCTGCGTRSRTTLVALRVLGHRQQLLV
eukprot:4845853-Amphidinium_carterae.1